MNPSWITFTQELSVGVLSALVVSVVSAATRNRRGHSLHKARTARELADEYERLGQRDAAVHQRRAARKYLLLPMAKEELSSSFPWRDRILWVGSVAYAVGYLGVRFLGGAWQTAGSVLLLFSLLYLPTWLVMSARYWIASHRHAWAMAAHEPAPSSSGDLTAPQVRRGRTQGPGEARLGRTSSRAGTVATDARLGRIVGRRGGR